MDSNVYLWDLATLRLKGTRKGLTSGVESIAFDGKSVLLGAGFGCKIFGWDLDAELDRPIFQLWGHEHAVISIFANGFTNRCYSLDASGEIRLWDTSKSNPNDKEERQIDSFRILDDHIRSFEISSKLSSGQFNSCGGGAFIIAHGRRQHAVRVADVSPKESPFVKVLFSSTLKLIVLVHTNEIVFWDAASGEEVKKVDNVGPVASAVNITTAEMDDRQRKVIVGDTRGVVTMYNMCNGIKLKTFPAVSSPIKFIMYSPDRKIIIVTASGDMYVLDENKGDAGPLRDTKTHEADVISATYSHNLGLIATADLTGTVIVWNYQVRKHAHEHTLH
jgi:WD40 repeat protein